MAVTMYGIDKSDGLLAQEVRFTAFDILQEFDNPSKRTYNLSIQKEEIMYFLFSEYEYGKDYLMNTNTNVVAVTETVLLTLQLKFL